MRKFGRNYELRVGTEDGDTIVIRPPFTLMLDITRNTYAKSSVAQFRIFNLSELNRNRIRYNISNFSKLRRVELRAGYGDNMPRIFKGSVSQASSVREGVNFVTTIESFSTGFAQVNGYVSESYPKGNPKKLVLTDLASKVPDTKVGAIGNYDGVLQRGLVVSGNPITALSTYSGNGYFEDDGYVNVLKTDEYILNRNSAIVVSPASGLIGTPVVEQTIVRFPMIFEPQLNVGVKVQIKSQGNQNVNGEYKCVGVKHRGIISDTVAGELITEGEFFYTKRLSGVPMI